MVAGQELGRYHSLATGEAVRDTGFTVVEMLVTIIVTAIFLLSFYTLFNTVGLSAGNTRQQAVASSFAYTQLSYTIINSDSYYRSWIPCNSTTDLSNYSSAPGYAVDSYDNVNWVDLPQPASYVTYGFYPEGCANDAPVMYKIVVTWGPHNNTVTQAGYAN